MNLQQTVEEILGRSVSQSEAEKFANEQFGLLSTYLKPKEMRFYVLPVDEYLLDIYVQRINEWKNFELKNGVLHKDAEEFITLCEQEGTVYSLDGFVTLCNNGGEEIGNSWLYNTDKY